MTLVREHLAGQREPRSAAEVATALGQEHPDRGIKANVVRTTLESLVARNEAQRSKQGTSVYYTAADTAQAAPAGASAAESGKDAGAGTGSGTTGAEAGAAPEAASEPAPSGQE